MRFLAVVVTLVLLGAGMASAEGQRPAFQLPFPCGQQVRMESYGHAPALDTFRVPTSETEGNLLVAPAAGTVNQSYSDPQGAGNIIQLNHGGGWFSTFIHLQSRAVSVGQHVYQGQPIGRVGHTGQTSNGVSHVHMEQAIDRNGDGKAEWGYPNNERVPQVFDGVTYGTANSQTFYATSHNCGNRDVTGNGYDDIVARQATSNDLYLYDGDAPGHLAAPRRVGTGWGGMRVILTGDFDGDGRGDIIGVRTDGVMFLYAGKGNGTFGAPRQIGAGWGAMDVVVTADFTGDGHLDLLSRRTDGHLFLYSGNGNATFAAPREVAQGWTGITAIVAGDFTGDGHGDLVGRTPEGILNIYSGHGDGAFNAPREISHGWTGITALIPGDFSHDGRTDIAGRTATGDLLLYTAGTDGTLSAGVKIGDGWNSMDLFQS